MIQDLIDAIRTCKVIAISRKIYGDELLLLADALVQGGIRLIEVTFDQKDPDAAEKTGRAIAALKRSYPQVSVGAGTVLTPRAGGRGGAERGGIYHFPQYLR